MLLIERSFPMTADKGRCLRALTPHARNVPDQVLRRLPENGVVMASFISSLTSKDPSMRM